MSDYTYLFENTKISTDYQKFLLESPYVLDFDEYKYASACGFITEGTLVLEQVKGTDSYRELESTGRKWLKYGLGTLFSSAAGIYHAIKHGDPKYAAAGIGASVVPIAAQKAGLPIGQLAIPLAILYMWWQRKSTDICNNKCGGNNRGKCYYTCYVKALDKTLALQKRDLATAKKMGKKRMTNTIQTQIKNTIKKRDEFQQKLSISSN